MSLKRSEEQQFHPCYICSPRVDCRRIVSLMMLYVLRMSVVNSNRTKTNFYDAQVVKCDLMSDDDAPKQNMLFVQPVDDIA